MFPRSAGSGVPGQPGCYLAKACSKCHIRKVKCDGVSPVCTPCAKSGVQEGSCNVREGLVWTNNVHTAQEVRIRWLEESLSTSLSILTTGCPTDGSLEDVRAMETGFEFDWPLLSQRRTSQRDNSVDKEAVPFSTAAEGAQRTDLEIAEEVGLLTLRGQGQYVGSASGVTFARILLSAIKLYPTQAIMSALPPHPADDQLLFALPSAAPVHAGLPPPSLATAYVSLYLDRVHRWWPFLRPAHALNAVDAVYQSSPRPTPYQRFLVFGIFSIGSSERSRTTTEADVWCSADYWTTALSFLPTVMAGPPSLESLSAMLLAGVRSLRVDGTAVPGTNLWQLAGIVMRTALELGLTRAKPAQGQFTTDELIQRRWLWWCTYALERHVAVITGRVLSLRNEAIDAEWPAERSEPLPSSIWPVGRLYFRPNQESMLDYRPALHSVSLQRILGDVLETVYIARPSSRPSMSMSETSARVHSIQNGLISWASSISEWSKPNSLDADMLNLSFHNATLLLHRPSPSFPLPTPEALAVCLGAARGSIKLFGKIVRDGNGKALYSKGSHFLDLFLNGLTVLYCSWASPTSLLAITSATASPTALDADISTCEHLLASWTTRHALPTRHLSVFQTVVRAFTLMFTGRDPADPNPVENWATDADGGYGFGPDDTLAGLLKELGVEYDDADQAMDGPVELDGEAVELVRRLLSQGVLP